MPLNVYIAPMKFYSKQGQGDCYYGMVVRALNEWEKASNGKIKLNLTDNLLSSNINVEWKRVDRTALGHCYFNYDNRNRLFSAEVSIGLSDGLIHAKYMAESEVYHTILHEVGHALGLGHSTNPEDIMYTPHQYGVTKLSLGDMLSLQWLYSLPQGATIQQIASQFSCMETDIDIIIAKVMNKMSKSEFEQVKEELQQGQKRDLLEEHTNIGDLKKYQLSLQNISLPTTLTKQLKRPKN